MTNYLDLLRNQKPLDQFSRNELISSLNSAELKQERQPWEPAWDQLIADLKSRLSHPDMDYPRSRPVA